MPDRPWKDEYTLLCEQCGYVVEGLDPAGNCPECGKPIVESLPERRVGTPWQQKPGVKSLLATWWMTLRHPLRTLDVMRIDSRTGLQLARWSCAPTLLAWPVTMALTWIEARGLQLFGAHKNGRITPAVSWAVVGHGAVGWAVVVPGVMLGALLLDAWLSASLEYYHFATAGRPQDYSSTKADILLFSAATVISMSLLIGFLFFETFAYLGLRRCKYANRVRTESPSQGATTRREAAQ